MKRNGTWVSLILIIVLGSCTIPNVIYKMVIDVQGRRGFVYDLPKSILTLKQLNVQSIDSNLGSLSFASEIYSCDHALLGTSKVKYLHTLYLKVIPWTINEETDINQMIS